MSSQPPPPSGPFGPPPTPGQPTPPWGPGQPAPGQYPPAQPPPAPSYPEPPGQYPPTTQIPPTQAYPPAGGFPPAGGPPPGQFPPGGGGFGGGGFQPTPPPKGNKNALIAIIAVVLVIGGGVGIFFAVKGGDDKKAAPTTTATLVTLPSVTSTSTTTTTTTLPPTTTSSTTTTTIGLTLPSTVAPATTEPDTAPPDTGSTGTGDLDLGHNVRMSTPAGYTKANSPAGTTELQNGHTTFFVQVLQRTPGESPVDLIQEYINTFDSNYDAVTYTALIPDAVDTSGKAPSDGNYLFYRAINQDGKGVRGLVEAVRRADGLSYVTDTYHPLDDKSNDVFPQASFDELHANFLDSPLTGSTVDLSPLSMTRTTSVHQSYVVDGFIALTPPKGWNVDAPGPGRIVFSRPDGQRFLASKIDNQADLNAGKEKVKADTLALVADAQFGDFQDDTSGNFGYSSARWTGTDPNGGGTLSGFIEVWVDPKNGEAYESLEAWFGTDQNPPSPAESDFLFHALDVSINQPHA